MAAIRQQLGPSERWSFYDQHDYIVIGTSASRQLLACSRNYRLIRDQYRSSSPPPPKWRTTSPQWASLIWALPSVSIRRRGTLRRIIWDQLWHEENQLGSGSREGTCLLCQEVVWSQVHILCTCPALDPIRCDQLSSIRRANLRIPPGPRCLLASKYLDMATTCPLEDRALL